MLSRNRILAFLVALMVVFSVGCATKNRVTDFTIISTKNLDLSRLGGMQKASKRASGEDKLTIIMGVSLGSFPTIKEAIDACIESIPGAVALVDGVIYNEIVNYTVASKFSYIVEGTPLVDSKVSMSFPSKYIYANYSDKDHKFEITYVSKEEFKAIKAGVLKHS